MNVDAFGSASRTWLYSAPATMTPMLVSRISTRLSSLFSANCTRASSRAFVALMRPTANAGIMTYFWGADA